MNIRDYCKQIQDMRLDASGKARIYDAFYKKKHRTSLIARWVSYSMYGAWIMGVSFALLIVLWLISRDDTSRFPGYRAIITNELYTRYVPDRGTYAQAAPLWYVLSITWDVTFTKDTHSLTRDSKTIHAEETIELNAWAEVSFLVNTTTQARIVWPAAFQLLSHDTWTPQEVWSSVTLNILYGTLIRVSPYTPTAFVQNPLAVHPQVQEQSVPRSSNTLIVKTKDVALTSSNDKQQIDVLIAVDDSDRHTIHNAWSSVIVEAFVNNEVVKQTIASQEVMTVAGDTITLVSQQEAQTIIQAIKDQSVAMSYDFSSTVWVVWWIWTLWWTLWWTVSWNTSTTPPVDSAGDTVVLPWSASLKKVMTDEQHSLFTQWVSPNTMNTYIHRLVSTYYNEQPELWQRIRELGLHIQSLYRVLSLDSDPSSAPYYAQATLSLAWLRSAWDHLMAAAQENFFVWPSAIRHLSGLVAWLDLLGNSRSQKTSLWLWLLTFEEIIQQYQLEWFAWYLILR